MPRCKLYSLGRDQAGKRIMGLREMQVHRRHDFGQCMWTRNRQHLRMGAFYHLAPFLGSKTAGDDDFAIFRQRFPDRVQ